MRRILSPVIISILIVTLIAMPTFASAQETPFVARPLTPNIPWVFSQYHQVCGTVMDVDNQNNVLSLSVLNPVRPTESNYRQNKEIKLKYREDAQFFDGTEYNDIEEIKTGEYVNLMVFNSQIVFAGLDKQVGILPQNEIDLEVVDLDDVPDIVTKELEGIKEQGGYSAVKTGSTYYLIASSGEKPTGGYSIKIYSARNSDDGSIDVFTMERSPKPGDMVTQVITHPYDIKVIKPSVRVSAIRFLDNKGNVLKVINFD